MSIPGHMELSQMPFSTLLDTRYRFLAATESLRRQRAEMPASGCLTMLFGCSRGKTGLRGFRPGVTQTGLYSHRGRVEA